MSDIIRLMEQLASVVDFQQTNEEITQVIQNSELAPELKQALLDNNSAAIESILDARTKIVCMLAPAEDDEDESSKESEESPEEKTEESILV